MPETYYDILKDTTLNLEEKFISLVKDEKNIFHVKKINHKGLLCEEITSNVFEQKLSINDVNTNLTNFCYNCIMYNFNKGFKVKDYYRHLKIGSKVRKRKLTPLTSSIETLLSKYLLSLRDDLSFQMLATTPGCEEYEYEGRKLMQSLQNDIEEEIFSKHRLNDFNEFIKNILITQNLDNESFCESFTSESFCVMDPEVFNHIDIEIKKSVLYDTLEPLVYLMWQKFRRENYVILPVFVGKLLLDNAKTDKVKVYFSKDALTLEKEEMFKTLSNDNVLTLKEVFEVMQNI